MLSILSSTLGRVFGTDKAVSRVVDHTANALDKLIYTDEEEAEAKAQAVTEARSMVIEWMKATSGQNLARRLLAMVITLVWVSQYVAMMSLSVIAVWLENGDKCNASSQIIGGYAENMNGAMMLILGFYFAAPHLSSVAGVALKKFSK